MYLKKINIEYFRRLKKYEVEFAPRVTVLFGKNGSGKSTLIHAIHKALSFIFYKDRNNNKNKNPMVSLTAGFPELRIEKFEKRDVERDEKTGLLFPFIEIKAVGSFEELPLSWEMSVTTDKSEWNPQKQGYTEAYKLVMQKVKDTNVLPFIAYYSDSFPHIPKDKKLTREQYGLRNVGYLDWNQESACSELWIERYKKTWEEWDRANRTIEREESALRNCDVFLRNGIVNNEEYTEDILLHKERLEHAQEEKNKHDDEVNSIKSCLIKFSKGDMNYEVIDIFSSIYEEEGLCLQTKQRNNPSFHKLPAGYRRLFYMVFDIAYRSYMLNKHTNPRGIAIIDEIDLHLHPELEQVVLKRLMDTFPNLQFIVSTHSPLVLTGLETKNKDNIVQRMVADTEVPEILRDVYGIDYNLMLEESMEVPKRNAIVQEMFDKAWESIGNKRIEEAKICVANLEKTTPADQPELVRLRSLIKRLEVLGK